MKTAEQLEQELAIVKRNLDATQDLVRAAQHWKNNTGHSREEVVDLLILGRPARALYLAIEALEEASKGGA